MTTIPPMALLDKPKSFEEACRMVASAVAELVISKQRDYGKGNIKDFGEQGILLRANDKFARLKNLILNNKEAFNETIDDTWMDVAGYAIVALLYRWGWFDLPLEEKC